MGTREPVTHNERIAAARVLIVANQKRGIDSPAWLRDLAGQKRHSPTATPTAGTGQP